MDGKAGAALIPGRSRTQAPEVRSVGQCGVLLAGDLAAGPVDLLLNGRRLFSTRLEQAGTDGLVLVAWPEALRPHLRGSGEIAARRPGSPTGVSCRADLGGGSRFVVVDGRGRPLVVNKWGRLGRALEDSDDGVATRLLDHADEVAKVLEQELGLEAFATGGTLLGAVREGRLLGHDDDVDLGYLSRHDHPCDVAREGYEVGRVLRNAGFTVLRHSAGHVQMHFTHDGASDHFVDVFAGFLRNGHWHQLFCIRHPARRSDLLPRSRVHIEGRAIPAPANVELALEANYGASWRVPDPAFRFDTPITTRRRLDLWFPGMHADREDWLPARDDLVPSARARRLLARDPALPAIDLGCGTGADTAHLARHLGRAVGIDWSLPSLERAREALVGTGGEVRQVNMRDLRAVVRAGARLAAEEHGWVVLVGQLLARLDPAGRDNVLRLLAMVLRRGGFAVLDRNLATGELIARARRHGLAVQEVGVDAELRWSPRPSMAQRSAA